MLNISFLTCTKVELYYLIVCIVVNAEKFQSPTMTLTLIRQCQLSNLSEIFSYTTMHSSFIFLHQLFLSNHANTHTQTHTDTHTRKHTHTHTHTRTHTHRDSDEYSIVTIMTFIFYAISVQYITIIILQVLAAEMSLDLMVFSNKLLAGMSV